MSGKGWIGVDLDGTLAWYDHWRGETHIGGMVPAMKIRILRWLEDGMRVKIFTARIVSNNSEEIRSRIKEWLVANGLPELEITNVKDPGMLQLW